MTEEQTKKLIEKANAQRLAQLALKQRSEQIDTRNKQQKFDDKSTIDKVRGVIGSVQEGQLLGFGDEIVGAGRALSDYAMDALIDNPLEDVGEKQSFGDRYRMYRDDERKNNKEFSDANQKTALALSVLGGVASPVNFSGKILNKINVGAGPVGASTAAASSVAKRSLLEGGVAGLGMSEADLTEGQFGQAAKDAAKGSAFGLGTTVGLRTLGRVAGGASTKKVAEDLVDETGRRKPLSMVDEPIGRLYRSVGRMPGARGKLKAMENPYIDEALERVYKEEDALVSAKALADATKREASEAFDIKKSDELLALQNRQTNARNLGLDEANQVTDDISFMAENTSRRAAEFPAEIAEREADKFRAIAARKSLPSHAQSVLDDIDTVNDISTVRSKIADYWKKDAFSSVKKTAFEWGNKGSRKLRATLRERIADDPDLALALDDALGKISKSTKKLRGAEIGRTPRSVQELSDMLDANIVGINGEALMAIRNQFASGANGVSKNGWALRQIANEFDDFIRSGLKSDELVSQFNDDISRYTTALSYMDASASNEARKAAGKFTPSQWMSSSGKYTGKGMSSRIPPLENTARSANQAIVGGKQQSVDSLKAISRNKRSLLKGAAENKREAGRSLSESQRLESAQLKKALSAEKTAIDNAAREESARIASREVQGPLVEARKAVNELKENVLPRNVGPLSDYLMARQGGAVLPGFSKAGPYQAAQGVGLGRMLASGGFQDFLAGQTEWQRKLLKDLTEGTKDKRTRVLSQQAALQTGGGLPSEPEKPNTLQRKVEAAREAGDWGEYFRLLGYGIKGE